MAYSQRTIGTLHVYQRKFIIRKAASRVLVELNAEYTTRCRDGVSSSWEVTIRVQKRVPFYDFKIAATLKRLDDGGSPLQGFLLIWLMDNRGKKCPVSYRLKQEMKGHEVAQKTFSVDKHFKCLLTEKDETHLTEMTFPSDVMVVRMTLFVSFCHGADKEKGRDVGTIPEVGEKTTNTRMILAKL